MGGETRQNIGQLPVQFQQARGQVGARCGMTDAVADMAHAHPVDVDHAPAKVAQAWVYADYAHHF